MFALSCLSLLACRVSVEKSGNDLMRVPCASLAVFPWLLLVFGLCLSLLSVWLLCLSVFLLGTLSLPDLAGGRFSCAREVSPVTSSDMFSDPLPLFLLGSLDPLPLPPGAPGPSPSLPPGSLDPLPLPPGVPGPSLSSSWGPWTLPLSLLGSLQRMWVPLVLSQRSVQLSFSPPFILSSALCSAAVISTALPSRPFIHSSASVILLSISFWCFIHLSVCQFW